MPVLYTGMDFRQLKTFIHVAELGSLSKAADRLRIAQPALSRQIRLLEQELKVALFTRHGRGMVLTPPGEMLLARVVGIFRDLDAARADVLAETSVVTGRVVLGTPPTIGDALSARLIDRFLAQYPNVSVRIVPAFSGYLLDWLQRGEIDIAVMYEPEARLPLKTEPLIKETLHAVAAPRKGLAAKRAIGLSRVLEQRLILPGPVHGLRKLVERAAARIDVPLDIVVEADSLQTMKDLVERGLGWTILPLANVQKEVAERRLVAAEIGSPQLARTMVVAEGFGRQSSRAVRAFREMLVAEVHDMVRSKVWAATPLKPRSGAL